MKKIMMFGMMMILLMGVAMAAEGRVCASVCTTVYELDNGCQVNNCGSGCGADGVNTFKTQAQCKEAQGEQTQTQEQSGEMQQIQTHAEVKEQIQLQLQEQEQVKNSSIVGLERARLLVSNEIAKQAIERNIEKMTARNREMLEEMNQNGEMYMIQGEENAVVVQGRTKAKFLGLINANREMTLVVDENGEVVRKGRPLDFLFRYQEQVREVEVEA